MDQVAFLNDSLNKADATVKRITAERDRWRQILVDTVGEDVAEMKYRD
jgi:hypothetical protein